MIRSSAEPRAPIISGVSAARAVSCVCATDSTCRVASGTNTISASARISTALRSRVWRR